MNLVYAKETSNGRGVHDLHETQLPTYLNHGVYVVLALTWASWAYNEIVVQVVEQITDAIHPHGKFQCINVVIEDIRGAAKTKGQE